MATALAHRTDPDTSHHAAETLNVDVSGEVKGAILTLLLERPRAAFQLTAIYFSRREANGWPLVKTDNIAKRLSELRVAGRVVDSGERAVSQYGKPAVIWRLPEADVA